jgi:hypothetical protein
VLREIRGHFGWSGGGLVVGSRFERSKGLLTSPDTCLSVFFLPFLFLSLCVCFLVPRDHNNDE